MSVIEAATRWVWQNSREQRLRQDRKAWQMTKSMKCDSFAEICKAFLEKDVIWMGAYIVLKLVYTFWQ